MEGGDGENEKYMISMFLLECNISFFQVEIRAIECCYRGLTRYKSPMVVTVCSYDCVFVYRGHRSAYDNTNDLRSAFAASQVRRVAEATKRFLILEIWIAEAGRWI